MQERYIYYLSKISPYTQLQTFFAREQRKGYETNLSKLNIVQAWFVTGKEQLEV